MSRLPHPGPWQHADDFMAGFVEAKKAGLHWEYVEFFLVDFAETKDAGIAKRHAMREWDL